MPREMDLVEAGDVVPGLMTSALDVVLVRVGQKTNVCAEGRVSNLSDGYAVGFVVIGGKRERVESLMLRVREMILADARAGEGVDSTFTDHRIVK